ncbi:MAG: T9SS type A sorting domain-containing protein [Deferribacteres bacterium]|nr:T9SS type A sorting domain-containing protein [candidate division KSB1 bacterium]MCB9502270.1 T9SS type A sorting domain-containing protein [Deferribacteres bacterium]
MNSLKLTHLPVFVFIFLQTVLVAQQNHQIIKTFNFQLVKEFQYGQDSYIQDMIMSADGSTILFSNYETKTFAMNADGSNTRLIYDPQKRTDPWLDISADGGVYVLGHPYYFIIGRTDGSSAPVTISTLPGPDGNPVGIFLQVPPRITADGKHVYIGNVGGGNKTGGLWRVNADGGKPTQLFSYEQMEIQYSIPYIQDWGNYLFRPEFDISDDGSRVIFATAIIGGSIKLMAYSGGTLRILIDPIPTPDIEKNAISGDGETIAFYQTEDGNSVLYTAHFDGSNQIKLFDFGWNPPLVKLIRNGNKIFAYWIGTTGTSVLINTDGTREENIGLVQTYWLLSPGKPFAYLGRSSISFDGNRCSFLAGEPIYGKPMRIWVGEINSSLLGTGPTFSNINMEPDYLLTQGRSTSTFSAAIAGGSYPIVEAGYASFMNGFYKNIFQSHYRLPDDGTKGDLIAGDGIFTLANITSNATEDFGDKPFSVRFSAWTEKAVSEVEVSPFYILENAPSGTPPEITSISPSTAGPGAQVTIYGSGFNPVSGQNTVYIGSTQVNIVSATTTQIIITIPGGLSSGNYTVTVSSYGQSSNTGSLVVSEPNSSSLNPPRNLMVFLVENVVFIDWEPPLPGPIIEQVEPVSEVSEIEPNNRPAQSQALWNTASITVNGHLEVADSGILDDGFDDIEDLYRITLIDDGVEIQLSGFTSDCDLYLFDSYATYILDVSINSDPMTIETISYPELEPGTYLVGVSIVDFDPQGPAETAYSLSISGNFGKNPEIKDLLSYNIYRSTSSNVLLNGELLTTVDAQTNYYDDVLTEYQNFFYQVTAVYTDGESMPTNESSLASVNIGEGKDSFVPNNFALHQNYPNPVNSKTRIQYTIPEQEWVEIILYNMRGQKVMQIVNAYKPAGSHSETLEQLNLPSGLYFYKMKAGIFTQTRKMLVIGR